MSELKPCPFCGGDNIKFTNKTTCGGRKRHVAMYCDDCHAYGPRTIIDMGKKTFLLSMERKTFGRAIAVKAWNNCKTTKQLATITAQRDEFMECLCDISNMCIGEIAMGRNLDANAIGQMIFDVTGLNNPDLNKILSTIKEQKDAD